MSHIDELTIMMYIDHELNPDENLKVASHLVDCTQCQAMLAHWQAEQSFFHHSFASHSDVNEIQLSPSILQQIEAIAHLHKQNSRQFTNRFILMLCFFTGAFVYLAVLFQGWMFQWMASIWNIWQHSFLWSSTFWMKEQIRSLLAFPDVFSVTALFIFLLCSLLFLNIYKYPHQDWYPSKGVLKK